MNESQFWGKIRGGMLGKWHATRIESATMAGIPDICATIPGRHLWIELKYLEAFPKKASTKVRIDHFTDKQREWIMSRGQLAGNVWVIIGVGKEFFVFPYHDAYNITEWTADEWRERASLHWDGKAQWLDLYTLLLRG